MSLGYDVCTHCERPPPLFMKILVKRYRNKSAKLYGAISLFLPSQFESVSVSPFESLMPFLSLFLSLSHSALCPSRQHFSFCRNIWVSIAVRNKKHDTNAKCCGREQNTKRQGETGEVRGEAREGQAALSGVHSSYFPLLICLVLVPSLLFQQTEYLCCSLEKQTHRLALRGKMQMARCSTPPSSLTSLLFFFFFFCLSSPSSLMIQEN